MLSLLLIVLIALPDAALPPAVAPVRNGIETHDFPYVGRLIGADYECSATLLPRSVGPHEKYRYILTAAHCAPDGHVDDASSGATFLLNSESAPILSFEIPVTTKGIPPDIALGRLQGSFVGPQHRAHFALSSSLITEHAGISLAAVGYGDSGYQDDSVAAFHHARRVGTMEFLSYLRSNIGKRYSTVVLDMAPQSGSDNTICSGDSGGGLFYQNELVGVHSAGSGYAAPSVVCIADVNGRMLRASKKRRGARLKRTTRSSRTLPTRIGRPYQIYGYLADISRSVEHDMSTGGFSYDVAERFCAALNNPRALRRELRRNAGIRRPPRYFRGLKKLSKSGHRWSLPSAEAARLIMSDQIEALHIPGKRKVLVGSLGKYIDLIWADTQASLAPPSRSTLSRRTEIAVGRFGNAIALPPNPTDCDLQFQSEATSVFHYREWIHAAIAGWEEYG